MRRKQQQSLEERQSCRVPHAGLLCKISDMAIVQFRVPSRRVVHAELYSGCEHGVSRRGRRRQMGKKLGFRDHRLPGCHPTFLRWHRRLG